MIRFEDTVEVDSVIVPFFSEVRHTKRIVSGHVMLIHVEEVTTKTDTFGGSLKERYCMFKFIDNAEKETTVVSKFCK